MSPNYITSRHSIRHCKHKNFKWSLYPSSNRKINRKFESLYRGVDVIEAVVIAEQINITEIGFENRKSLFGRYTESVAIAKVDQPGFNCICFIKLNLNNSLTVFLQTLYPVLISKQLRNKKNVDVTKFMLRNRDLHDCLETNSNRNSNKFINVTAMSKFTCKTQ